jgi:hypothetical protein
VINKKRYVVRKAQNLNRPQRGEGAYLNQLRRAKLFGWAGWSRRSSSPTLVNDRLFAAWPISGAIYERRDIGVDLRH